MSKCDRRTRTWTDTRLPAAVSCAATPQDVLRTRTRTYSENRFFSRKMDLDLLSSSNCVKSEENGQTINTPAASERGEVVSSHLCGIFSREKMARGKNETPRERKRERKDVKCRRIPSRVTATCHTDSSSRCLRLASGDQTLCNYELMRTVFNKTGHKLVTVAEIFCRNLGSPCRHRLASTPRFQKIIESSQFGCIQ